MRKFERASMPEITQERIAEQAKHLGLSVADIEKVFAHERENLLSVWLNDRYQVNIYRHQVKTKGFPAVLHLSIKRIDKEPIHDWRDLQWIKNQLVGPDHEAFELYPAEDRVVDTANQYHLWVFKDPEIRVPVGWATGVKIGTSGGGAKQRPFG